MRRVDDRLGLAVCRSSLSSRTLVTYARDHVTVRTPSRPDLGDGNTIDLEAPPRPTDLDRWVDRFRTTVGQLGARRVQLRWEIAAAPAAPPHAPEPPSDVAHAAGALGLALQPVTVLLLGPLAPRPPVPADLVPVEPPPATPDAPTDRRWHAATVLYRYDAEAPGPDGWRDWDERGVAARVEEQRELAAEGRARVWLAQRHGAPVGRATVVDDRQGLARVEDVVVHPVHRRAGVGAALVHRAVSDHLDADPDARVGAVVRPASPADRLVRRLGFVPHATVWTARG